MINLLKILLQASIVSSLMIGIVVLFRLLFSKKLHPGIISFLWLIVLIKLCFPVNLNVAFNIGDIFAEDTTSASELTSQDNESNASFYDTYDNLSGTENNYYVQNNVNDNLNQNNVSAENSEQLNTKNNINMWNIFLWIWIAGMILTSAWFTATNILFSCKVKKHAMPFTDESILAMIEKYKKELGIKRKMEILSYPYIQTPLVFRYFSAKILLPANFKKIYDYEKMDGVIVHELTHIKRHDVLLAYCWTAVKAIYWFNPFVWIASFFQKEDAELTCDYKTIRAIDRRKRAEYGESLILAARLSGNSILSNTALSFSSGKSSIHKRINMIISPNKKSKSITVVSFLIILIMIFACFTSACQPTPEDNIVVNKGDDSLDEIIDSSPAPESEYIVPETWEKSITKENVAISINAVVNVPDVSKFPVVGVDYIQFDKSYVEKAIEVFFGEYPPLEYTKRTKEYLENYILQEKERLATIENDPEYQESDKEQLEEKIEDLQEEYQTAPSQETSSIIVDDTSLKEVEQGMSRITLSANLGEKGFATLDIWNATSTKNSQLAFSSYSDEVTDIKTKSLGDNTPNGVSISITEAISIAENALKEMGVDDMTLTKTSLASLLTTKTEDVDTRSDNEAYMLTYEKSFGGIVVTNYQSKMLIDETSDGESNTEQYAPRLISEQINIMIDDSGIISFIWKNPTISTEIISENVAIKELNDIKEIFKQHIFYHQWYGDSDGRLDIYIERVELSYFLQPVKNSIDVYRAIPVWDFIGVRSKNGKEPTRDSFESTFLTINAIDGSIINRKLGY